VGSGKRGKYNSATDDLRTAVIPRTIYFYYVEAAGDDGFNCRAYMWDNPDNDPIHQGQELKRILRKLVSNARNNGIDPRPLGSGFDAIPWSRKSYLAIALDDEDGFEPGDALAITRVTSTVSIENHCFFDGDDAVIYDEDGNPASVMWTVNYMIDEDGNDLSAQTLNRFAIEFKGKDKDPHDGGDHGTNMGPPIGPP
jgi:hypothetical protein